MVEGPNFKTFVYFQHFSAKFFGPIDFLRMCAGPTDSDLNPGSFSNLAWAETGSISKTGGIAVKGNAHDDNISPPTSRVTGQRINVGMPKNAGWSSSASAEFLSTSFDTFQVKEAFTHFNDLLNGC